MQDSFGDRMKYYESFESERRLMPLLPIIARMDGKCFHNFCEGLKRPFDPRLSQLMQDVTNVLVKETGAFAGYTQSDEITLGWFYEEFDQQMMFDGRVLKIATWLSALTSVAFNRLLPDFMPEKADKMPTFDGRVFSVPNLTEAANEFLWREMDATRNSVSMAAQAYFSHNILQGKDSSDMQEMLWSEKNINWNDYPAFFKRGTYIIRRKVSKPPTPEELENLPPKHHARRNPEFTIERTVLEKMDMPPFVKVSNREGVLFRGETPTLQSV
jgi:tRNA(His) guanylyltransferase